ncbi:hypothetical protein DUNSADRAFT_3689 [Dunaliella salina]|uniref:DNA-directed primase/polymerase protein n=1 Tax=Dunaliella salina TaxID=3046 RepID=A0ABQ7GTH9_DUNSA|nr:hypothetical protein DUNSADRAFT_3689 [Dunaliella salina]|eukprot:KAF5837912.1 hypothetical protein DUNSADRAFT_3689 [Dunaliella salina]
MPLVQTEHSSIVQPAAARPGSDQQQPRVAGSKGSGTAVVCDEGALEHPAASHRSLKVTWLDIPQNFSSAEEAAAMSACRHALQRVALRMLRFIEAAATERAGGLQAFVGSLTYCGVSGNVTYSMLGPGSHWCSRIQRSHRSNRVYFLANLSVGNWCQKCFDRDCAGYHSAWRPLPEELLEPLPDSQPPKSS